MSLLLAYVIVTVLLWVKMWAERRPLVTVSDGLQYSMAALWPAWALIFICVGCYTLTREIFRP